MTDLPPGSAPLYPPSPSGQTYLIHAYEHRAYPLSEDESFWIGRSSQCDIMISEVFVSRRHAEIRPEGSDFVIHPVGSTPTLVNDIAIYTPRVLREGDIINIGTMRFTFTRDRLPVAMQVADPWLRESRLYDEVNERRPTLTFPVQTVGDMRGPQSGVSATLWLWIALIIVALIVAYFVFDYYATM